MPTAMFGSASEKPASMPCGVMSRNGGSEKPSSGIRSRSVSTKLRGPTNLMSVSRTSTSILAPLSMRNSIFSKFSSMKLAGAISTRSKLLQAADHADLRRALPVLLDLRFDRDEEPALVVGAEERVGVRIGAGKRPVRDRRIPVEADRQLVAGQHLEQVEQVGGAVEHLLHHVDRIEHRLASARRRAAGTSPSVVRSGAIAACTAWSSRLQLAGIRKQVAELLRVPDDRRRAPRRGSCLARSAP